MFLRRFLIFITIFLFGSECFAQDYFQGVTNKLLVDLNFRDDYDTTNAKNEFRNTNIKSQFYSKFKFKNNFSLNSNLKFEEVDRAADEARRNANPNGGGDKSFENQGLFVEQLNIAYDDGKFDVLGGKYTANFGRVWRYYNSGIWIKDLATEYRQNEKLGFEGGFKIGDAKTVGQYHFMASAFTNDRKNFDNSIITKRDSVSKSDAKAGDTRSLQSYVGSLDINFDFGEKEKQGEKLAYNFSYINLAVNSSASLVPSDRIKDQKGFVAGLNYRYPLFEKISVIGLAEYSKMDNVGGDKGISDNYFTGILTAEFVEKYIATFGYFQHDNIEIGTNGSDRDFTEISLGYKFDKTVFFDTMLLEAGLKYDRTNYKISLDEKYGYGVLLRYIKKF